MYDINRFKLAEAVGGKIWEAYIDPNKNPEEINLPDPENNANDCEALITWLLSKGWHFEISIQPTNSDMIAAGAWIHIWQDGTEIHHRTDVSVEIWKRGVCALAMRVIE